jgi:hypothetical protein
VVGVVVEARSVERYGISSSALREADGKAISLLGEHVECLQRYTGVKPSGFNSHHYHSTLSVSGTTVAVEDCGSSSGAI